MSCCTHLHGIVQVVFDENTIGCSCVHCYIKLFQIQLMSLQAMAGLCAGTHVLAVLLHCTHHLYEEQQVSCRRWTWPACGPSWFVPAACLHPLPKQMTVSRAWRLTQDQVMLQQLDTALTCAVPVGRQQLVCYTVPLFHLYLAALCSVDDISM